MKDRFAGQYWTVPNLLGYFRLLLIPVFAVTYLRGHTAAAFVTVGLSALSDVLDGPIARRLNQTTDLGKLLDPVADKLTEGTMILCIGLRHRPVLWLFLLMAVKESCMSYMGFRTVRMTGRIHSSRWYGKVCTVLLYASMLLLILLSRPPLSLVIGLTAVNAVVIVMTLVLYARWYHRLWLEEGRTAPGDEAG